MERIYSNKKLNIYGSEACYSQARVVCDLYGRAKGTSEWIFLSEEFLSRSGCFVDVKVRMLYDGKEGDILNQYVTFTKIYNEQVKEYGRTKEAVLETICICKNRKILKEYLESREKEVVDIMMTLFDQEYAVERYGDEKKAEGKAEGLAEGKVEGLAEGEAKGTMKAKQEMTYKLVDRRIHWRRFLRLSK